jgi:hypothetical protein
MTRFIRSLRKLSLSTLGSLFLLAPATAFAQGDINEFLNSGKEEKRPAKPVKPSYRQIDHSEVMANGDVKLSIDYVFNKESYLMFKTNIGTGATAIRRSGVNESHAHIENPKINWVDGKYTMELRCMARGSARVNKKGEWEIDLIKFDTASELLLDNNVLCFTLNGDPKAEIGVKAEACFKMPEGTTNVKLSADSKLTYKLPVKATTKGEVSVDFDVTAKESVMSSLAKTLGNRKFKELWTSRSVFRNTGDRNLSDYRVRFRITDYSPTWSPWSGSKIVVPGQTVVDVYYPTFDMDRITKITGQSKMAMEIEYQYRGPDGQLVTDTDSKDLQLLSRNNVYYSSMNLKDQTEFQDIYNLSPQVLASFVSFEDPVVQQASGRISNGMGGSRVQTSDEDALAYMEATYRFLAENIRYQAAVGNDRDRKFIQHVKYARDVLRNRSGTCIDLAITYASLCQAAGLEPLIFIVPGHAFAAVKLPKSGRIVPVECTLIGVKNFATAVAFDEKEYFAKMQTSEIPFYESDICKLQKEGVMAVDLPLVSEDVLEKWGIKMPNLTRNETHSAPHTMTTTNKLPKEMAGDFKVEDMWVGEIEANGKTLKFAVEFKKDGTFEAAALLKGSTDKPMRKKPHWV